MCNKSNLWTFGHYVDIVIICDDKNKVKSEVVA